MCIAGIIMAGQIATVTFITDALVFIGKTIWHREAFSQMTRGRAMEILFICTGNTCRSAMAEKILNHLASSRSLDIYAHSAGTRATQGGQMNQAARKALEELGITNFLHSTQPIPNDITADLILTATSAHRDFVLGEHPELRSKVFTIKEFAQRFQDTDVTNLEIEDPLDSTAETYRQVANEIKVSLEVIVAGLTS
jgi:protein-tyrosine-phosphatase